jgi:flagellar basal body-associated protein FliL
MDFGKKGVVSILIVSTGVLVAAAALALGFLITRNRANEAKTTTSAESKIEPTVIPTSTIEEDLQKELDQTDVGEIKIEIEGANEL